MLFLSCSWLQFFEINCFRFYGLDDVKKEFTIGNRRVLQVLDMELTWDLAISPSCQLLIVDLADSFLPVHLADLPDQAQS